MRTLVVFAIFITFNAAALANPDGAPWGSADPNAAQNCASCHYDNAPVTDSTAISISGLPKKLSPGVIYDLVTTFRKSDDTIAGIQVSAFSDHGHVGAFTSNAYHFESNGSEVRSTVPSRGIAQWELQWRAPKKLEGKVTFYIAVNEGNDDQSPFGDVIHFKSVTVATK